MPSDSKIFNLIKKEQQRQKTQISLIPSENHASKAVIQALGTELTNKYSEGYPYRRYYQGNAFIDEIETIAVERAKKIFGVPYVNVQPYSGSPANSAVYFAALAPGDKIMGMKLSAGGHLTHGHPKVTLSGRFYTPIQYDVDQNGWIDMDEVAALARKEKPAMIVVGTTAYPRTFDWKRWRVIADSVGAHLHADISHIAGLIVGGVHPSPVPYVDTIMTTTHKTLRGPRGAMIMVTKRGLDKNPDLAKKIASAVFPGLQGGPHDNVTASIAIALYEAMQPSFKKYAQQIVANNKALGNELVKRGHKLTTGGTDNHLMVVDLRAQQVLGIVVAEALEMANIICNKNTIPHDPRPPFYPSGIRLGTPSVTTRGMKEKEMKKIAAWIHDVIEEVKVYKTPSDPKEMKAFIASIMPKIKANKKIKEIAKEVQSLTKKFPIY